MFKMNFLLNILNDNTSLNRFMTVYGCSLKGDTGATGPQGATGTSGPLSFASFYAR